MAAATGPVSAPALSQKQRRAALRKERRKRKRQALAQNRETDLNDEANHEPEEDEHNEEDERDAEEERRRLHEEWLEREREAQEEFRMKTEREEAARKRQEVEERLIKEEWDARQKDEQEQQEQKRQEKRDREEAVQKMLDEAESQLENGGPWRNPETPVTETSKNYGTERDVANCPFFLKTGACRFGTQCSRRHIYPTSSTTLLIRSMFMTFGMVAARRDDYDIDASLEHSEEELQENFIDFYHDVLPEFRSVGTVVQFKVSCNYESHLRGNVYVQFETEEQCKEALLKFNGRWYAGRQLQCELCPVTRWKNAICGLFNRQKCPKGKHCNFLHVFRNPGNEFWEADRDISPNRKNRREGWHSERRSDPSWRHRTPPRSERSYSRQDGDRRRSTSRERWGDERGSRSRYSERRSERYRSRSKDRRRSRSRSRDQSKRRSRDGDKNTSKSEKRNRDKNSWSRSRSRDKERHKRSRIHSPKEEDKQESNSKENGSPHQRHKHSKKSKKSKKKEKKKSRASPEPKSSSEDLGKENPLNVSPKTEEKRQVEDALKEGEDKYESGAGAKSESKEDISEPLEDVGSEAASNSI